MNKMKLAFFIILLLCKTGAFAQGDEDKISIAILPFIGSFSASSNYVSAVQESVAKEFVSKSRFVIVDRSKFSAVLKELNIQKSEEFLNSKVVEQGKLAGAQYMVTGIVSDAGMKTATGEKVVRYANGTYGTQSDIKYQGTISFSFQVIDVATGKAVYQENIDAHSDDGSISGEGNAMQMALCRLKRPIKKAMLKLFPPDISIVQVEKKSKKGLPEKVLISAGASLFDEGKADGCGGFDINNAISNLLTKKGVYLKVYQIEILTINGKEVKREKEVGKLKLDEVQGEVSICKVDDGEKEIGEFLNAGKKLYLKIL